MKSARHANTELNLQARRKSKKDIERKTQTHTYKYDHTTHKGKTDTNKQTETHTQLHNNTKSDA